MPAGSNANYWVHDLSPFLWEFAPGIGIRYYGLAYVLGFLIGLWLLGRYSRAGRSPLSREQNGELLYALVLGVLLGGRLGYFLLYAPGELFSSPLAFFRVWDGGMASHGGFVGVLAAALWFARRHRVRFWTLADLVATITPPGLLLGRLANFVNGELWGNSTRVPWAVIFPKSAPEGTPVHLLVPRHPSQLYEAAGEGLLLLVYLQFRLWRGDAVLRRPGQLTGEFLIGYAVARMFCELFREPDAALILGLSRGTFYSLFVLAAGAGILARAIRRGRGTPDTGAAAKTPRRTP